MFDTEKFIQEIEKRPAIYDVNRTEYNDRNAKMSAWDEVCQVMVPNWVRLTDEERNVEGIQARAINRSGFLQLHLFEPGTIHEKNLRGKWRNIRDYFIKELKLQKSQNSGPGTRKRKKYMYFDQLLFLMPTVENKRLVVTMNQCKSEESEGEVDNPVIEEYDDPLAQATPSITTARDYLQPGASYKICPRYPKQLCETTFTSFDNEIHDILSSHSSQRVVTHDEDDYDKMFLLSLLPIIRQVPDEKKLDVRIQIQQVLALAIRSSDNM